MISGLFDLFLSKKKKAQQQAEMAASPAFVIDRAGVAKAVNGLDIVNNVSKDVTPTRTLSKAAMTNLHLNKDYRFCDGKHLSNGVGLSIPKKDKYIPVDIFYYGRLTKNYKHIKLRKGEGNNDNWENVQSMDMLKTPEGYYVASVNIKKTSNPNKAIHNMHVAFYAEDHGKTEWDNNDGKNFSFEVSASDGEANNNQATNKKNPLITNQNTNSLDSKSSNIINNLLGISPKNNGSK